MPDLSVYRREVGLVEADGGAVADGRVVGIVVIVAGGVGVEVGGGGRTGDAFVETVFSEDAEGGGEAAFEVVAFFVGVVEFGGAVLCERCISYLGNVSTYRGNSAILPWAMVFLTPGSRGA